MMARRRSYKRDRRGRFATVGRSALAGSAVSTALGAASVTASSVRYARFMDMSVRYAIPSVKYAARAGGTFGAAGLVGGAAVGAAIVGVRVAQARKRKR